MKKIKKKALSKSTFFQSIFPLPISNVLEIGTRKDILLRIGIKLSTSFLNI